MLWGSTSAVAVAHLERLRISEQERFRIVRFAERWQLYCDDYADVIKAAVREVFTDSVKAERIALLSDATINPFKQVIDETFAYPGATRRFVTYGPADPATGRRAETVDPVYEGAREEAAFDAVMGEVSEALGGFNDAVAMVLPAREDAKGAPLGLPTVRVFFPHELTVVEHEDDPGQIAEVRYIHVRPDGEEVVIGWTATEHWVEQDGSGGRWSPRGRVGTANPFGRLPFVAFHAGLRPDGFWDACSGQSLVEFTKQFGREFAALNFLTQQQSYKQLHIKGVDDTWEGFKTLGPGTVLQTPQNVDLSVLDMQAQISQIVEKLKVQLTMKLKSYGINAERFMQNPGQAPMSGLARMIERKDLIERRKRIRPFVVRAEREFGALWRWAFNWNHRQSPVSTSAVFEAVPLEEEVFLSPEEQEDLRKKKLENLKLERELGLKDDAEQFAEYHGITVEEARTRLAARSPTPPSSPEIFAYDQDNGILTINEIRSSKGLCLHPNKELGTRTIPELRREYPAMFGLPTAPPRAPAIPQE